MRCSRREAEILELVAAGKTDKRIALELQISQHTVRSYLDRLFRRNGLPNRAAAAVAWALDKESLSLENDSPPE